MSKKQPRASLDAYFSEADSWARDRQDALRASRRIAWIVAGAALVVAVCEALALIFLMPLKTVAPYTLMVDRQTGFVQALKPLDAQLVSSDAALTQSFLVQYVIAREGYDINSLQSDYRKVGLWSNSDARSDYLSSMQIANADSPLARFPRSTVIEVRVKSVTAVGRNIAMVRFDTRRRDAGAPQLPARNWVAVIRYTYSGAPMSVEDRMVNPLGFQVTRYRKSIETLPPPEPEPVASPTPTPVPTLVPSPASPMGAAPSAVPAPMMQRLPTPGYPRTVPPPAANPTNRRPAVQL